MLGLLGTVTGMIISFSEIARFGSGDPGLLAYGIGQALVTTAAGLIVAIPVLVGHGYLASRVEKILSEIDRRREELMGNVVQAVANRRDEGSGRAHHADASDAHGERGSATVPTRPLPQV
jgi:biopolymer transport protein ExbB